MTLKITSREGMLYVVGSINGNRIRKSTGLGVRNKVEAEVIRANMELALYKRKAEAGFDFATVAQRYEARGGGISKTQQGKVDRLLRCWEDVSVDDIDQSMIDEYVEDVHRDNKNGTVRCELNTMKAVLNYGAERGLCKKAEFGLPPDGEGRTRYLSGRERDEVVTCLGKSKLKRGLMFLLFVGTQLSEIRHLKWGAIDDDSVMIESIKGARRKKKTRRVPLHQRVVDILGVRGKAGDLVFTKANGALWDKTGFYTEFYSVMDCAYIDDFTPHDCRYTFASHLVMAGADLCTVAELLGHSTMSIVMRYSHLSKGHLEDAIQKL